MAVASIRYQHALSSSERYGAVVDDFENIPLIESNEKRNEITNAINYALKILKKYDVIGDYKETTISHKSKIMGDCIVKMLFSLIDDYDFIEEEELIVESENVQNVQLSETSDEMETASSSSMETAPSSRSSPIKMMFGKKCTQDDKVPFEIKLKVVKLAELHPQWSLKSLQTKGSRMLKTKKQLQRWKKHILHGGSMHDKFKFINSFVYDNFLECREKKQLVTTSMLQQWAMMAVQYFNIDDFSFKASISWAKKFKADHKICQC